MTLTPVGVALKIPDGIGDELLAGDGEPLRYFPNGPIKRGYVCFPDSLLDNHPRLVDLMAISVAHVSSAEK